MCLVLAALTALLLVPRRRLRAVAALPLVLALLLAAGVAVERWERQRQREALLAAARTLRPDVVNDRLRALA